MATPARAKVKRAVTTIKTTAKANETKSKARKKSADSRILEQYNKYFIAPQTTPDSFRIFDITDGSSVSYSSHT